MSRNKIDTSSRIVVALVGPKDDYGRKDDYDMKQIDWPSQKCLFRCAPTNRSCQRATCRYKIIILFLSASADAMAA